MSDAREPLKFVMYPRVDDEREAAIREAAGSMAVVNCADEAAACEAIRDADAFFGKLTRKMLRHASRLRWVQSPTASLEHYVFPELVDHPCVLTNMRGLFSDVIADHVMGYVLCFARNLHRYLRQQQSHRWAPMGGEESRSTFTGGPHAVSGMDRAHLHLSDCTLGVFGLGEIGSEVARRAAAFGMRVVAVDRRRSDSPPEVQWLKSPEHLSELLAVSDFVVICAPLTPETRGLFHRDVLRLMKPTAYLINIGRGPIVVLDDLVAALDARELAGAALDVFEVEPLPPDHRLWDFENVILTPHVAACSVRIAERHRATLLENVRRFVAGQPLNNVVDKRLWF